MGATHSHINPTCWAIRGTYHGVKYDGINVLPLPAEKKVLVSVTTDSGQIKTVAEADFPPAEQTEQGFAQLMRRIISARLRVML
jgi:hypothetical protein